MSWVSRVVSASARCSSLRCMCGVMAVGGLSVAACDSGARAMNTTPTSATGATGATGAGTDGGGGGASALHLTVSTPDGACADLSIEGREGPAAVFSAQGPADTQVELMAARPDCEVEPFVYQVLELDGQGRGSFELDHAGSPDCSSSLLGGWTVWLRSDALESAPTAVVFSDSTCGTASDCGAAADHCPADVGGEDGGSGTGPGDDDGASSSDAGGEDGEDGTTGALVEECVYLSDMPIEAESNILDAGPYIDVSGWDGHTGEEGHKPIEIDGVTYEKGIAWFPQWNRESSLTWRLDGEYTRLKMLVRMDDEYADHYEWGLVRHSDGKQLAHAEETRMLLPGGNPDTGKFGDFRAAENYDFRAGEALLRVGPGGRVRVHGDDAELHRTEQFGAWGPPEDVDVDITGVTTLRIYLESKHYENDGTWYRKGLTNTPVLVDMSYFDVVDLADAQLCRWR